jgi:hypothetical protein
MSNFCESAHSDGIKYGQPTSKIPGKIQPLNILSLLLILNLLSPLCRSRPCIPYTKSDCSPPWEVHYAINILENQRNYYGQTPETARDLQNNPSSPLTYHIMHILFFSGLYPAVEEVEVEKSKVLHEKKWLRYLYIWAWGVEPRSTSNNLLPCLLYVRRPSSVWIEIHPDGFYKTRGNINNTTYLCSVRVWMDSKNA